MKNSMNVPTGKKPIFYGERFSIQRRTVLSKAREFEVPTLKKFQKCNLLTKLLKALKYP